MIAGDYEEYKQSQIVRAESKWGRKFQFEEEFKKHLNKTIDEIADFIVSPEVIGCMGCRSGSELFEFKERFPSAKVCGVDITENINTIKKPKEVEVTLNDFNHLPLDWESRFDLVFSNSLDHAYDPKETLKEWHRVARRGGFLLVELSTTPANNIEHTFRPEDIDKLFPASHFEQKAFWATPKRNTFTVLVRVVK